MLNWTPIVIANFIQGSLIIVLGLWSLRYSESVKNKTIQYLKATWITLAIFYFMEALSFLYLDLFLGRIYGIIGFVLMALLIIAISYNYRDRFLSIWLLIDIAFGIIAIYLAFTQPNAAKIEIIDGYYRIVWTGFFEILATSIILVFSFSYLAWLAVTLFYSPYDLRKYAYYAFISLFFQLLLSIFLFFIIKDVVLSIVIACIGLLIRSYVIHENPGLFYILPFKAYRLTVLNKNGDILIKYVWSRTSSIDLIYEILASTESTTIEKMKNISILSEESIEKSPRKLKLHDIVNELKYPKGYKISHNKGNENVTLEMKYPEILIYEGRSIIVKFEVSKITSFLRNLIEQFVNEFEFQFGEELDKFPVEKEKHEEAYQLIEKYFFMFPSTIVTSPKESFLISSESFRIDEELETKIRELFPEEEDFNFVKDEIQRAPEITLNSIDKIWKEMQNELETDMESNY